MAPRHGATADLERPPLKNRTDMLHYVVAGLAFTAPPSLTRRDMITGMGAAAAMVQMPALAYENKYAGSADRRAAEKKAKEAPSGPTPYQEIVAASRAAEERAAKDFTPLAGAYSANGKAENGVSYRKPNDPNGCSDVNATPAPGPFVVAPRVPAKSRRLTFLHALLCRVRRRASNAASRSTASKRPPDVFC